MLLVLDELERAQESCDQNKKAEETKILPNRIKVSPEPEHRSHKARKIRTKLPPNKYLQEFKHHFSPRKQNAP